jgi:hypothetical protein
MFGNMVLDSMFKSFQSPLFDDPRNQGLGYEGEEFNTSDGKTLRGWLSKSNSQVGEGR